VRQKQNEIKVKGEEKAKKATGWEDQV